MNTATIVGRIGQDPEFKVTPNGHPVATFSVAVDRTKKGETDWFRVECWRQAAEFVRDYATKGRTVAVSGSMQNQQFEDRDTGKKRDSWKLVADRVNLVGPKPDGGSPADTDEIAF